MPDHVFVVTFCPVFEQKGEFFEEEAYKSLGTACGMAMDCMERNGGFPSYKMDHPTQKPKHVHCSWSNSHTTVLVEILTLVT